MGRSASRCVTHSNHQLGAKPGTHSTASSAPERRATRSKLVAVLHHAPIPDSAFDGDAAFNRTGVSAMQSGTARRSSRCSPRQSINGARKQRPLCASARPRRPRAVHLASPTPPRSADDRWLRSTSCVRSDFIDISMPATYSLTYENDDPTFRRSTAQGQEEGRRARANSNLADRRGLKDHAGRIKGGETNASATADL